MSGDGRKQARYRSPYEAYPFLSDDGCDLRCDFEILTDRMASMTGALAARCPEKREELLKVDELIYHFNPTLRTFLSVTEEETDWLLERADEMRDEVRDRFDRFVLPAGSERACAAHVLRVDSKGLVRMLYRAREGGLEFSDRVIDVASIVADYFFMLALWLNKEDGVPEIPFNSRNY